MTVNEMIRELMKIQAQENGDAKIVSDIITDWGDEKIHDCEYDKRSNTVRIS